MLKRTLAVAPMMDWTDRHDRYLLRLISRHTLLYTEMVTTGALLHGDRGRFLDFAESEHPVALQVGGSDPHAMAACAKFGAEHGYDEININVGCPSDRVQSGRFGACLMAEPQTVADCWSAMAAAVDIPVTVKTRTGIDDLDSYTALTHFVSTVAEAGCRVFIIHARKAWLSGLSPKENREIPPLQYPTVYRLKRDYPELEIVINGGVRNIADATAHLAHVDGAMIGREAYHNPYVLAEVDRQLYGDPAPVPTRHEILESYLPYVQSQLDLGVPLAHLSRHLLGLFQGQPGARAWRRYISENAHKPGSGIEVIQQAADRIQAAHP